MAIRIRKRIKRWLCGPPRIFTDTYRIAGGWIFTDPYSVAGCLAAVSADCHEKEKRYQKTRSLQRLMRELERHGLLEHRELEKTGDDYRAAWVLRV